MTFGISVRLALVLALMGMVVASLTGFYAFSVSRSLLVQSANSELMTSTHVLSRRITLIREEVSRNLQVLARHPATLASLQGTRAEPKERVAELFEVLMQANPAHFQIRLISAQDSGLEQVRVDRDANRLVRVRDDDLQEKGHFPYVSEALKLPAGENYLSPIAINHEQGAHAGQDRPTVQLASPVTDAQGVAHGVVVINIDLEGMFVLLSKDLPADFQLYLANRNGDYLIHPDPSRTFGFDKGRRVLMQQEFAGTGDLVSGKLDKVILQADIGEHRKVPLLAAFLGWDTQISSAEGRLILGLAQPTQHVLQQADRLRDGILRIVALVSLVCAVLAILVARAVTGPIHRMNAAIQRFANGNATMSLPIARKDEIGMLARSFQRMQTQIKGQMADLQDSQEELEHLAQHDMLTELPNRRMFMERLDQAIARAVRNDEEFALLFIDVDNFKQFNDTLGHAAGDLVLTVVAQRLSASTRKVDTVARLGGDEFVVLLDKFSQRDQIAAFTEKLLTLLKTPIPFGEQEILVEFSIGISQFPEDGRTGGEIISQADNAMYKTKSSGRNGYRFTSDTETQTSLL